MSGLTGAINTALSGLTAFEAGINTVSGNLANQTTNGYGTETVSIATASSNGQTGAGVQAPQIIRAADGFSASILRTATSSAQAANTLSINLTSISNALQNNGDVHTAISQFFQDVSSLSANPASAALRQTVFSDASSVTGSFHNSANSLNGIINGSTAAIGQNIGTANDLLSQLSSINHGLSQTPNNSALLDQQEAALKSLSAILTINVLPQSNGQAVVSSGGTILLDQSGAQTLALKGGSADVPPSLGVGNTHALLTLNSNDGTLGANIQTWLSGTQALQSLNAQATLFTSLVNQVQAQGLTNNGQIGSNLFATNLPNVISGQNNTGAASLNAQITNPSQLPTNGGPFQLTYDSTNGWTAVNQTTQQSIILASGSSLSFAGLTVMVSGTPANGDHFLVNPVPDAASNIKVAAINPNAIASADPYVVSPGVLQSDGSIINNNAGNIIAGADTVVNLKGNNASLVPASYYGQSLQLNFTSPTNYIITPAANPGTTIATGNLTANQASVAVTYPAGAAAGKFWQITFSGTAAAGDVLTFSPGGNNSGSNASRLGALWTAPGVTSDGSLQQSIVGLGTSLGLNAQQAQQLSTSTSIQATTASNNLQTISGVSLDQQAVILTSYSQAYQAAAQVISSAHTMFESLLQAI